MKTALFLLTATPEELIATSVKEPGALELLAPIAVTSATVPTYRVLIAHLDQLHNFVQSVPPLAWELLEYASEPLEIVYPQRKPLLLRPEGPATICVRWVKQPRLLRFLQKEGPMWAVRPAATASVVSPAWKTIDCTDKKYPYKQVKTVVVAADGTFTFLR